MDVPLIHFIKDMYDDILMNLCMKNLISQWLKKVKFLRRLFQLKVL